jgi:mono/diheme cytochrome c family protein
VTEIPEHLLKRSKERRAAIGGEEAEATSEGAPSTEVAETEATAPAPAAAAAVATPEPAPVPKPVRPEVAAALSRKKVPYWAMPVLAALPLWAYVYQATLEPAPTGELTPVEEGGEIYDRAACVGCHQAGGGGSSSAPSLEAVEATFPDFRDHLLWVRVGNAGWLAKSGDTYGATDTPTNGGTMPDHPTLTDQELAQVVLYERVEFGGMQEEGEEYELLLALAEGATTFDEVGLGELSEALGFTLEDLKAG